MARSLKDMIRGEHGVRRGTEGIHGAQTTFIVEALLLLICLMMVIAVSVAVIAYSTQANDYYTHKASAIAFGTNIAEHFSAEPDAMESSYTQDDLVAVCDVESYRNSSGTLYDASISVEWNGHELCLLESSRYMSNEEAM